MKRILFFYNLLFPVALLLLLPGALWRMARRGNYIHQFGQRFGWFSRNVKARLRRNRGRWIWIHAVSVGEVNVALKFIQTLQREHDQPVLLSTTTSTGFQLARAHQSPLLEVIYHPIDFWWTIRHVVRLVAPRALVLVEAEIWPNLLTAVKTLPRPVFLVNARLSQRSERRFRHFLFLVAPLFASLDRIFLQDESDRARYLGLGARPESLVCPGSIKFDLAGESAIDPAPARALLESCGIDSTRPLLLAASTHPGEELLCAKMFLRLREEIPGLFGVIVPRHFERAGEVQKELAGLPLRILRQSREPSGPCDLLLADTTGQLRQWIALASVVFVGKSLCARGGQNPAEVVSAGKPVVFGPQMQNFAALVALLREHHGAWQVRDEEELFRACRELLLNPDQGRAMAARATGALAQHQGATQQTVAEIIRLL
jgi:3-deoxy-D-manno-octulosonic-acid transferase